MTYCFGWKSDDEVYIVADSLTSSKSETAFEGEATLSSMGETYGEYNSYFIAETDTKIYIKNNITVAFAGEIDNFEEVKTNLDLMEDYLSFEEIMNYLSGMIGESELIVGLKHENNKLYHLNNRGFKEIDDYIAIGSGSEIPDLNNLMQEFTVTYPDPSYEPRKKLSAATAYLQMLSIKNNFLDYGVGGTFCGVCIHKEIEWTDDLLYFFYDGNFENKRLINVIIRKNSIVTGSDFTGLSKLFKYEEMDETEFRKMSRFIHKCISSHTPRYVVFYSSEFNNIYFCDIYKYKHTALMRMFQRRGKKAAKNELFTSPFLLEEFLLKNKNEEKFIIPFNYLDTSPVNYIPRDQLIENVENIWDVEFEYEYFDYPLENINVSFEISNVFKSQLEEYENVIIVNFDYLESKILELRNFYNGLNVNFDSSEILTGICERINKDFEIDNLKILLFSNRYQFFYNRIDNLEIYLNKVDCTYKLFTKTLLLNYYKNDRYYHLNKIFIIDDSSHLNDIFEVLPDYNRDRDEADIFMIKNQNHESQVIYSPYYYNADILISKIAGLSDETLGWWDPIGTPKEELEKIAEYLNSQIENSKL
ncbi:hypothetical protein COJ88_17825 [Bacillus cereus]|uniref:hypothetical protein n=1 Tax=Bacillus cereus TaxID=1396 RepID=UPI000BFAB08D|nr:hypothetical protein [Bacillus cereus]PFO94288.1 hypothetical protein COJ88_17825 [Bacillus cereus]PGL56206.1 hypothetical protein CN922_00185 [Bacillus cereus]